MMRAVSGATVAALAVPGALAAPDHPGDDIHVLLDPVDGA